MVGDVDHCFRFFQNWHTPELVKGATPCSKDLRCGVAQGSVLWPILYVLYTSPLGNIVRSHGLSCHFKADDTQLYCSFKLHDQAASVQAIESYLNDIDAGRLQTC